MTEHKIIGIGRTAEVYTWEAGKVLKLFIPDYPQSAVEKEFRLGQLLNTLNFPKPKAYEMISWQHRYGIVYDYVLGESLLEWVLRTLDAEGCAARLAELHPLIMQNQLDELPSYKGFLRWGIEKATALSQTEREVALHQLKDLPEGKQLCHGDFHPGNIMIHEDKSVVLDFMNVCKGPALYDIARTVFLIQYSQVPEPVPDPEALKAFQKALADAYLQKLQVRRDQLQPYFAVIAAARKGEAPEE